MIGFAFFPLGVAITLIVFLLWDLDQSVGREPKAGVCEPCRLARRDQVHACEGVLCTCGCGEESR